MTFQKMLYPAVISLVFMIAIMQMAIDKKDPGGSSNKEISSAITAHIDAINAIR